MIDGNNELENHIYYVCLINVILFLIGVFADVWQAKSKKLTKCFNKTKHSSLFLNYREFLKRIFYSSKMSFKSHFKNLQISSRCENLKPTAMLLQSCEIVDGLMPVACASSAWVMPLELSKALNFTLMITSGMFFTT